MNTSFDPAANTLFVARPRKFPWINLVLFLLTCLTTLVIGTSFMAGYNRATGNPFEEIWWRPSALLTGIPFMITIMSILFAHEMGHYLTCRHYGIDASLPYFIPFPNLFGTMGAFIRIRSPIHSRGALLDVGIAGPIAGFVVAMVALVFSIGKAVPFELSGSEGTLSLGEPLIFKLVAFFLGPNLPSGTDSFLHPVSTAAWFGLLVTALNLLPAGQLDGGHVSYALFQNLHVWISRGVAATMLLLGVFYWTGWLVWFVLLLIIRLQHPPTLDDWIPLQPRHILLGWIGLAMFILCFVPMPIYLSTF
jgi:membrane-associated protease RseP (regulator of RpoE activity)